ncbi:uncharacterized protein N7446_002673 [Penicillium canescens]|uniref:Ankyrin repeat protein n=1 Tax=Penicillium canescens TaxID=5083 RepID=A0AAD6IEJ6_PENCN|nr:uncharacterized protein N7446_002673 [Penicillium canescens]KAJ6044479.1 hypothetical protein N7460_005834 [Penicillium canescens]KAJ6055949.1 hypothetical protein N7444_005047 [Penicillium canescens]KAJ6074896.1 hypothetical protein N7446_002673 [Penicillium canescens]
MPFTTTNQAFTPTRVTKSANGARGAKSATEKTDGWAPIFDAAMKGDCVAIEKLITGPKDTQVRFLGVSPLLLATIAGHLEAVTLLLKKGADINDRDDDSRTIFTLALDSNHKFIADQLIKNHPNVTVTDPRLDKGKDWLKQQFDNICSQVKDRDSQPPKKVLDYLLAWEFPDDKNRSVLDVYWEHILLRFIGDVPRDIQRNYSPDLNLALIGTFDRMLKGHAGIRESARLLNSKLPTTGYGIIDTIVRSDNHWVTERWSYDNKQGITVEDGIDSFLIDTKEGKITNKMINYHVQGA